MVKMRLRRAGAKKQPFYRVIVADERSPRGGRFIDEIGYYNPLNNVTRAESAVALWAVFDRTKDFVYYSWEKVY